MTPEQIENGVMAFRWKLEKKQFELKRKDGGNWGGGRKWRIFNKLDDGIDPLLYEYRLKEENQPRHGDDAGEGWTWALVKVAPNKFASVIKKAAGGVYIISSSNTLDEWLAKPEEWK